MDKMREALMPFARKADEFNYDEPDDAIGYDGAGELFTVGDFRRARSALAALPSCEGWRPMSEAPKEKMTSVLVAQVGKPPVRAFWYDDHWHLHGSTQRLEADLEPTHWMPLPSPPERKET